MNVSSHMLDGKLKHTGQTGIVIKDKTIISFEKKTTKRAESFQEEVG